MSGYRPEPGAELEGVARDLLVSGFNEQSAYAVHPEDPLTVRDLETGLDFMLEVRAMPLGNAGG